jgi:hypothetical protein
MALGSDDQHALLRQPAARQPPHTDPHVVGQRRRAANVKAQLHCRRDVDDVLPALARTKLSSISRSPMAMSSVMWIMAEVYLN